MSEPTYTEALKISWLFTWRSIALCLLVGLAVGFIAGSVSSLIGAPKPLIVGLNNVVVVGLAYFVIYPCVVQMIFEKQFKGFRVMIDRDHEVGVSTATQLRKAA